MPTDSTSVAVLDACYERLKDVEVSKYSLASLLFHAITFERKFFSS